MRRIEEKIANLTEARERVGAWRAQGTGIVLALGAFDPLEAADARDLAAAHRAGTALVVGVMTDAAVAQRMGAGRPIVPLEDRSRVVAALATVDLVVEGLDDAPAELGLAAEDTIVEIARTPDLVARIRTRLAQGGK